MLTAKQHRSDQYIKLKHQAENNKSFLGGGKQLGGECQVSGFEPCWYVTLS